jgi:hypothetical protein
MFTLRRSAWIRWFPPIDSPSPSPVATHTSSEGLTIFTPEAMAGALPCIPWRP